MPLDQNPHQTVTCFGCVRFLMYACGFSVPQMRKFECLDTRQDQNELHLKRWFFLPKSAASVSQSQAHLAKRCSSVYTTIFVAASFCSFTKKSGPVMPLDQNPHQTVNRFGCVGFSMYTCGCPVPQMRQFCLFTYPLKLKWASSEKMIFFAKIGNSTQAYFPVLFKRIHNHIRSAEG